MKNRFDVCIDRVLSHEGGYVNDPRDPGGETKFGISKRSYENVNIKALTREDAKRIYLRDFWRKGSCDLLPVGLDYLILDAGINHGVSQAIKFLQRAVGVTADGIIGPKTILAVNKAKPEAIIRAFCEHRLNFYKSLKTFKTYGRGWTRRLVESRATALTDSRKS